MAFKTQAELVEEGARGRQIDMSARDKQILRRLARRVSEIAARPVQDEKRKLWYAHNALQPTRPVIFCDPENGWGEIITDDVMECETELARHWEWLLRREIFWGDSMGDDRVVEPYFDVAHSYTETDWGMHETKVGGDHGGSYVWESPLKSYDDLDRLRFPEITVDYEATEATLALANEIFGDLLQVRLKMVWWWSFGMTWLAIRLRGLEQFMMDMYEEPEGLHRFMSILRDGHMHRFDFLEKNNLLSLNNGGTYVGSGGFGYTTELPQPDFDGEHVRCSDMWGFAESQETVSVSPGMFEEFVFQYQLPLLERFGLNCYGCCEPLDKRWHVVSKAPRLRRVSVSPWADPADMAEKLGENYIFSMKPNPADISIPTIDHDRIRRDLRRAMEITRGCRLEVIMKDNHTIGRNPQNVIDWCRIAKEEAERVAGGR